MRKYVLGFAFDKFDNVALIRKNRPEWQAGLLNGIGGKVEDREFSIDAMVREFQEETGMVSKDSDWNRFATMKGEDFHSFNMECYWAQFDELTVQTLTDEEVNVYDIDDEYHIRSWTTPNLIMLVELAKMCKNHKTHNYFSTITVSPK